MSFVEDIDLNDESEKEIEKMTVTEIYEKMIITTKELIDTVKNKEYFSDATRKEVYEEISEMIENLDICLKLI